MATTRNPMPGLFKVTAKGKRYYYAFRNGPRIEAEYGTKEFLEKYLAARAPEAHLDRSRFGAYVALYKASERYAELADSTKRNWSPALDDIQAHFGKLPARLFDRPQIRRDIVHWRDQSRKHPRMADLKKQVLSRVCSYMVEEGVIALNPCAGVPNIYSNDRSAIIWTEEDLVALRAVASPEIARAADLGALTGLRQGDLLRLRWTHVNDLCIEVKTGKSGGKRTALIPMYAALREFLATIPKRALTVLTNTDGEPWKTGFGASWRAATKRAGLSERDLHFHDLRGTAATNFYRAGFNSPEIAETLGWSKDTVESIIGMYVKKDEILRDRIRRLERPENENRKTDSKTGGVG